MICLSKASMIVFLTSLATTTRCSAFSQPQKVVRRVAGAQSFRNVSSTDTSAVTTPWNAPEVAEQVKTRKRNNNGRFRQHVNPLARQYQQPTELSDQWPSDVYRIRYKPLHLDIGCSKGGFLLDAVKAARMNAEDPIELAVPYNYLGLEIRPPVAFYAKGRIGVHGATGVLDFIGCNANVDLRRLMERYHQGAAGGPFLERVSIQFPDPHFKSQHAKRRVVTADLVRTLAEYMPTDAQVFLQSDVLSVLDDMRLQFRESVYFVDTIESVHSYLEGNPWGVPTEREISVQDRQLPVYRSLLRRTSRQIGDTSPAQATNEIKR